MGEFFKGWRRKAGLVTLAMALLLTVAWMRSRFTYDAIAFDIGSQQQLIISIEDSITWWSFPDEIDDGNWVSISPSEWTEAADDFAEVQAKLGFREWIVPVWCMVLPLTLLSAWLILGKTRHSPKSRPILLDSADETNPVPSGAEVQK